MWKCINALQKEERVNRLQVEQLRNRPLLKSIMIEQNNLKIYSVIVIIDVMQIIYEELHIIFNCKFDFFIRWVLLF